MQTGWILIRLTIYQAFVSLVQILFSELERKRTGLMPRGACYVFDPSSLLENIIMNYNKKKDLQQIQFKVYIFWNKCCCCEEDLLLTNISLKGCNSGANYQILFITWALTKTLQLLICLWMLKTCSLYYVHKVIHIIFTT